MGPSPLPEPGSGNSTGRSACPSRSAFPSAGSSRAARRVGARRTPKGRSAGGCDPVAISYPVLAAFPPCACLVWGGGPRPRVGARRSRPGRPLIRAAVAFCADERSLGHKLYFVVAKR